MIRNVHEPQKRYDDPSIDLSSRKLLTMSMLSAILYLVLSLVIFHFFHEDGSGGVFGHGFSVVGQLLAGGAGGGLAAAVIIFLSSRPPISEVLADFHIFRAIVRSRFTNFDRIQLSLFAGVGEELLFRGAVQPLLGIWVTSAIFVGIHGYFSFKSAGHLLFGTMMFGLSVWLGVLFEYAGLIAAMCAHAVYDLILLGWVRDRSFTG